MDGTNAPVRRDNAAFSLLIHRESAGLLTQVATDETDFPIHRDNAGSHISSIPVSDDEDIYMADALENPHMLTYDRESPFTYLSSLSVRWAASKDIASHVQGRIKNLRSSWAELPTSRGRSKQLQLDLDIS